MKVRLSDNARAYLRDETSYLKARSTIAAKALSAAMAKARHNLQAFETMGFEPDDLPIAGLRRLVVGSYLLDYEVTRGEIQIVAIRNSRQLPPTSDAEPDFDYEIDDVVKPERRQT